MILPAWHQLQLLLCLGPKGRLLARASAICRNIGIGSVTDTVMDSKSDIVKVDQRDFSSRTLSERLHPLRLFVFVQYVAPQTQEALAACYFQYQSEACQRSASDNLALLFLLRRYTGTCCDVVRAVFR